MRLMVVYSSRGRSDAVDGGLLESRKSDAVDGGLLESRKVRFRRFDYRIRVKVLVSRVCWSPLSSPSLFLDDVDFEDDAGWFGPERPPHSEALRGPNCPCMTNGF